MAKLANKGIWLFFFKEYPRQTVTMVLLLALAGIVESLGAVSLVPLLGNLFGQGMDSSPLLQRTSELFQWFGLEPDLKNVLFVLCGALTVKAVLTLFAFREAGNVEAEVSTQLRIRLLNGILRARWAYFISRPAGQLVNSLSLECSQAGVALRTFGSMLSFTIQALAYLVAGMFVSWHLIVAGLVGGCVFFWVFRRIVAFVRKAGKKQIAALNAMSGLFSDVLTGAKPLKVMGKGTQVLDYIKNQVLLFQAAVRQHVLGTSMMTALHEPVTVLLLGAGLYVASVHLKMDAITLLTLAFFFQRILSRITAAQQNWQQCAALEGVLVSLCAKIDQLTENEEVVGSGPPVKLTRAIELKDIGFSYGEKTVLDKMNLIIPIGSITALCGPSGAGKSTLSDIVTGLSRPSAGEVLIDGVGLQELSMIEWRSNIGYVPQEVFLFNDTIRHNVSLGRECTDQAVWEALKDAGAQSFVESLDGQLDAMVGEQGRAISGGQRQRLMVARALLTKPSVLILDEATTGLDKATEWAILENVNAMKHRMAILVISHQEAVREFADQTIELDSK